MKKQGEKIKRPADERLVKYFEKVKGTGILATSSSDGDVDLAIYARPYVIDNRNNTQEKVTAARKQYSILYISK